MRVLQLHQAAATVGGADELMAHEARILRAAGHDVDQLVQPASEDLGLSAVRAGLKAVYNREAAREVRHRVETSAPDVVHVHSPFPLMSPAVFRVARAAGVPAVTTLHSYRFSCVVGTCLRDGAVCEDCVGSRLKLAGVRHACYHQSRPATAALTLSLGVHRALGTFETCVSRYLALTSFSRDLMVRDGFPPERVVVKPNSVTDHGFRPTAAAGERRVVFAARLVEEKGVRTLLSAWARLSVGPSPRDAAAGRARRRPVASAARRRRRVGPLDRGPRVGPGGRDARPPACRRAGGGALGVVRGRAAGHPAQPRRRHPRARRTWRTSSEVLADDAGWTFRTGDAGD